MVIILDLIHNLPVTPNITIEPTQQQQQVTNLTGSSSYSTYSDPILGISIDYPSNYEVREAPSSVGFASLSFEAMPPMDSPEFSLLDARKDE